MDPNQTQPTNQPTPTPAAQPATPATPNVTPDSASGSKMMWIVLAILALLIASGVVGYLYISGSNKSAGETSQPATQASKAEDLQSELDSIQIEDVEREFVQVDSDLQNL